MQGENGVDRAKERLLAAALPHVAFDGWSEATLRGAIADSGIAAGLARALFPRGGVDMALAWHCAGDAGLRDALASRDLGGLRYRDRIALAVRVRIEAAADREAVRRGTALFALPQHAADGARAIWGTADAIWLALGDTSRDVNWYTKRTTLSGVYAATVLYWLGDDSPGQAASWEFLDRRIDGVMAFEKLKSQLRDNVVVKAVMEGPMAFVQRIAAPKLPDDLPGSLRDGLFPK